MNQKTLHGIMEIIRIVFCLQSCTLSQQLLTCKWNPHLFMLTVSASTAKNVCVLAELFSGPAPGSVKRLDVRWELARRRPGLGLTAWSTTPASGRFASLAQRATFSPQQFQLHPACRAAGVCQEIEDPSSTTPADPWPQGKPRGPRPRHVERRPEEASSVLCSTG